jgi:branched-chain amino acid aminotransferase
VTMPKVSLNWAALRFGYRPTPWRVHAICSVGQWHKPTLVSESTIELSEAAPALMFAQQCFEAFKVHENPSGEPILFRGIEHARRLVRSARRLAMPPVPEAIFFEAVAMCVRANLSYLPPHDAPASSFVQPCSRHRTR